MQDVRLAFVPLQKYYIFSGRARRKEFWLFQLLVLVLTLLVLIVAGFHAANFFSLAVTLPWLAVGSRRLHDQDKSAWWLLLLVIPLIGFLVLVFLFCLPGTDGDNRFGDDPLDDVSQN